MPTVYLADDFSLIGTLVTNDAESSFLEITRITAGELTQALGNGDFTSAVRNEPMAVFLALIVECPVSFGREIFHLNPGDVLYVVLYKVLRGGAMTEYFKVTFPESTGGIPRLQLPSQ